MKLKRHSNNLIISIILSILFSFCIITRICNSISTSIIEVAKKRIDYETSNALKKAFSKKNTLNIDINNILEVVKNSKDEIVEVNFKIPECEKILMTIIDEMSRTTDILTSNGYKLEVPLGYMTNSPLLVNLGPKIPVKIETTDMVMGNVSTKIREFGINNALVEVYTDIEITLSSSLPLNKKETTKKYSALLTSKIIAGTVPNFYNGSFSKTSEDITIEH